MKTRTVAMGDVEDRKRFAKVTLEALDYISVQVIDTIMMKNADYADAWQRQGIPGIMSKLADKLCRVETLADGREALVAGEGLEDALIDAIGYSMLGLLYLNQEAIREQD